MSSMRPSGVRKRIIEEHGEIRKGLEGLEALALRLDEEGAQAVAEALHAVGAFYEKLREHIDLEDAILAPALRDADAWGEVRAEKLERHHAEQRQELSALGALDATTTEPGKLAKRLRAFILDVREDMRHEEDGVLSADLLRDDVIMTDPDGS